MDRPLTHQPVNPEGLLPPEGFSHAVVAAPGRTVHLGGQTGHRADGTLADDLVAQFDQALANLVTVLRAAGAEPTHLVSCSCTSPTRRPTGPRCPTSARRGDATSAAGTPPSRCSRCPGCSTRTPASSSSASR